MSDSEDIVAHDDNGKPITRNDLLLESYRPPVPDNPFNLIGAFDDDESDEQFEEKQLIEAVRRRRRLAK